MKTELPNQTVKNETEWPKEEIKNGFFLEIIIKIM